jgi:ABC-type nitrate/sulfonate/bicarbonate transport system ATPase subunit
MEPSCSRRAAGRNPVRRKQLRWRKRDAPVGDSMMSRSRHGSAHAATMSELPDADQHAALGHLRRCEVQGLFGDRDVTFETADSGPTLLYGTNGTGKSTVLRLIDDIAQARWASVLERPFARVRLTFRQGGALTVARTATGLEATLNGSSWSATTEVLREARRRLDARRQRARDAGRPVRQQQLALFGEGELDVDSKWILAIPKLFPVFLIEDQRLIAAPRWRGAHELGGLQAAVADFADDLRAEMVRALSVYAAQSQQLDRLFPMKIARAFERDEAGSDNEADAVVDLQELLEAVQAERAALQEVGLLGREEGPVAFDAEKLETEKIRPVIQIFAKDTLEKFSVLRDVRTRLELFRTFLNQHYQGKTIETSRERGFVIRLDDGGLLSPSQLSSGEQQILALAFRILFRSKPGTLILIDEPELSLHVVWQSTLIDDLAAMGNARDVTFLLATHSPTLIGDRTELMRSLDAPAASRRIAPEPKESDELLPFEDEADEDLEELEIEALPPESD